VSGAPQPRRLGPRPLPRPDPATGVFETLLVADGRPVALDLHLARLEHSVGVLYGAALPAGLAEELLAAARHLSGARLRVDARPRARSNKADIRFELTALADRQLPVRLCPVTVPGGIGAHKWIDRRLLEALGRDADGELLLCALDGLVLEAARASVFTVEERSILVTPPVDGRILPGVTRARVLALARELGFDVRVEHLSLERLASAREIFVAGSLGGVEPAGLDAGPGGGGEITARLAHVLRDAERVSLAPV
jgi:para-aminobenzoate synthetase / 4-amino-4-deoxychorismate lyase